jgi:cytochrome c-type biogenesis protein CcmH
MILFWILGALLAAGALALALRPLLARSKAGAADAASRDALNAAVYRDQLRELDEDLRAGKLAQADYDRARAEIERRVLEDVHGGQSLVARPGARRPAAPAARPASRQPVLYAALAVPVVAAGVYFLVGTPRALNPAAQGPEISMREIETMVQRLADRLEQQPDDVEGWKMLGKSYSVMGRFAEAANAYSKAAMRAPRDAQVLADLADSLAMARGQNMKGEPEELVLRALQLDPKNLKALALAGTAAFDRRDFRGAARYWERMLPLVEADSEDARTIQSNINEAKAAAAAPRQATAPAKPAAAAALKGVVRLAPGLASRISPSDTLFVYARAVEGPPMPLAVLRRSAADLPLTFALDDSMAMSPVAKLSAFPKVVVTARISKSGSATPQPGDLQGMSAPIANSASAVAITIDKVVP